MSVSSATGSARSCGRSSTARGTRIQDVTTMPSVQALRLLSPCAATASMFLFAYERAIVCCHHDTLEIEKTFLGHAEDVQLLSVDNQSEVGGGRLVASYDAGQTAVVWDLMTAGEVARFASFGTLTSTAWMRDGRVIFGNDQGDVLLFDPKTSEHASSRTIAQIAVTAIAPYADCNKFALGYQNGSLLIAKLLPQFTILHSVTTSRAPSPVVTMAWHATSSRQKSDMLSVQSHDGDLRVWSVAKNHNADDPVRVARVLCRGEQLTAGPNWMGWSKNGRVIQFSHSETVSWDVRTKHVTCDSIPTLDDVKGLAVYGPGATLFTVGSGGSVQQFDLNSPSVMVAEAQHQIDVPPVIERLPASPERSDAMPTQTVTAVNASGSESSSVPFEAGVSESDEEHMSPFARLSRNQQLDASAGREFYDSASPMSSRSGISSVSESSTGSHTPGHTPRSLHSRGLTENTYISAGSSLRSSIISRRDLDGYSIGYSLPSTSMRSTTSSRLRNRPSRLRHEVPRSPDDNKLHDLFKFTRTRLSDVPYTHPTRVNNPCLTNDDLRKQMLSTIFGWHLEVEDLIRDEISRHPVGSAGRIILAKWLGEIDADIMNATSREMSSSDWMLLALSTIGRDQSQRKLGRAYVQRLLEGGDVHVAVTIMLGMGDHIDAIEVYLSHRRHMEALILTCMTFPSVWERQAAIIRKWGEWAVQHGQQQLAIRCFACTSEESSEPWRSPSAVQLNFQSIAPLAGIAPNQPEILSPPLSPPDIQRGPRRSIAKTSALKLITSFGDRSQKLKFYAEGDGGQTPIAAGVTPIADSAASPGGHDISTAFLRPSSSSKFNTPTTSVCPGESIRGRRRLPSIGELPSDLSVEGLRTAHMPARLTGSPIPGHHHVPSVEQDLLASGSSLQRASTASPMMMRDGHVEGYRREQPPSPSEGLLTKMQAAQSKRRNGSRNRIPQGINLRLGPFEQSPVVDLVSPEQEQIVASSSSTLFHWPSRRRGPGSVASSIYSASSAGRNPRVSQKQRDDFNQRPDASSGRTKATRSRGGSVDRFGELLGDRQQSQEGKGTPREPSEERGRSSARGWAQPKRSPTSPIPMSPEEIANMSAPKVKSGSRASSRGSARRNADGRPRPLALDIRGRDAVRGSSHHRSPSSPVPLSATAAMYYQGSEDEEDFQRALQEQELFRAKHSRSTSCGLSAGARGVRTGTSPFTEDRKGEAVLSTDAPPSLHQRGRKAATEHVGDLRQMKDERQRKKEQAARELEERRRSLAQRSQAAPIPHPNDFDGSKRVGQARIEMAGINDGDELYARPATAPPKEIFAKNGPQLGLPATPKAMRLIVDHQNSSTTGKEAQAAEINGLRPLYERPEYEDLGPSESHKAEPLSLLPSTVYQPPQRLAIPRSMSAPIPEHLDRSANSRKASTSNLQGIDEVMKGPWRRSQEDPIPPPPLLKELQHLVAPPPPPPPPPAPTFVATDMQRSQAGGAFGSGLIEIVTEEDDDEGPSTAAPNDGMVPILSSAAPRHRRDQSASGCDKLGRMVQAVVPVRSISRSRKDSSGNVKLPASELRLAEPTDSSFARPHVAGIAPPIHFEPIDVCQHISTGLNRGEMI